MIGYTLRLNERFFSLRGAQGVSEVWADSRSLRLYLDKPHKM